MAVLIDNVIQAIIFGESHGEAIGVTINNFPAGVTLDRDFIAKKLALRQAKRKAYSTSRLEGDEFEILSGVYNKKTTGQPITAICRNQNIKSEDYANITALYRPSHADYSADIRYKGLNDPRGGGHFSGRLTAPMVFVGALSELALMKYNVKVYAHIKNIKHVKDKDIDKLDTPGLEKISENSLPVIDCSLIPELESLFEEYQANNDSLGGIVEAIIKNVRPGIGSTHAEGLESRLSKIMFAIPAVKGIEFGLGFAFSESSGKNANDQIQITEDKIFTLTNNNGGITGGISNGEDIIFRVAFKCVPSISLEQKSINKITKENTLISVSGRHDVCFVPRTIPVIEGLGALTILDAYLEAVGYEGY